MHRDIDVFHENDLRESTISDLPRKRSQLVLMKKGTKGSDKQIFSIWKKIKILSKKHSSFL